MYFIYFNRYLDDPVKIEKIRSIFTGLYSLAMVSSPAVLANLPKSKDVV